MTDRSGGNLEMLYLNFFRKVSSETPVAISTRLTLPEMQKMGKTQKIGSLGEELVVRFLMKRGFKILDRNYRRPWGELDVVAERKAVIHFIEVKSLSGTVTKTRAIPVEVSQRRTQRGTASETVSSETDAKYDREKVLNYIRFGTPKDWYRPEDNVSRNKMKRLSRIIQTYLMGRHVSDETAWQFDVATVLIDTDKRKAKVNLIKDIILERR